MNDPAALVEGLIEALALKDLPRAGWVRRGLEQPESVAAHSWGVAWLTVALLPPDLDLGKALAYAVLHDLAEVRVGDLTPHDGVSADDKAHREARAMRELCTNLPAQLVERWLAYERQADPEARFVRQLDRLDMALQAAAYAQRTGMDLTEFFRSARKAVHTPGLLTLLDAIEARQP